MPMCEFTNFIFTKGLGLLDLSISFTLVVCLIEYDELNAKNKSKLVVKAN